jgi:hypothetical protein
VISIEKVIGGYEAHATPPHIREEWRTTSPMTANSLAAELLTRGAHQTDIGDAFSAADPNWISN